MASRTNPYLKMTNLPAGTYYVMSEGYSTNGNITTNIDRFMPGSITPAYKTLASGKSLILEHIGSACVSSRQWQISDNNGSWTDLSGATGTSYNAGILYNSGSSGIIHKYRVKINWADIYSDEATITVVPVTITVNPSTDRNYIHTIVSLEETTFITAARSPFLFSETIEYFDGLGRPLQTVSVGASPDEKDIVTPIAYDKLGRQTKKYLPYRAATNNGSYKTDALTSAHQNFYNGFPATNANEEGWSDTDFESSPLNRIKKEVGTGKDWHGSDWKSNGKYVVKNYRTNIANEVRLWKAENTQVSSNSNYAANKLTVTETTD